MAGVPAIYFLALPALVPDAGFPDPTACGPAFAAVAGCDAAGFDALGGEVFLLDFIWITPLIGDHPPNTGHIG